MILYDSTESRDIRIVRDFSIAGMDPSSTGIRTKVVEELISNTTKGGENY